MLQVADVHVVEADQDVSYTVEVSAQDDLSDKRLVVRCTALSDGMTVALAFTDSKGQDSLTYLTPQLAAAVRAALALVDLPGATVVTL